MNETDPGIKAVPSKKILGPGGFTARHLQKN